MKPPSLRGAAPWAIAVLALLAQGWVLWRLFATPVAGASAQGGDIEFYHHWALRILQGHYTDGHAFYGLPGYAWLVAAFYRFLGSPESGLKAVLGLQCLVHAGTALLIYGLARRAIPAASRGNLPASIAAALAWIFFIPAQALTAVLMPTSWAVLTYWLCVWVAIRTERTGPVWPWAPLGLLIGLIATLVATVFFALPLLVVSLWRRASRRLLALGLLFIGVGIGTSPAWIHNVFVVHEPAFLSAHGGVNFWIGNYPGANGYPKIPPPLRSGQQQLLDDSIRLAEEAAGHPLTRPEVSRYWSDQAWTEIHAHPQAWFGRLGLKVRAFWNAFSYDDLTLVELLRENDVLWPGLGFGLVAAVGLVGLVTFRAHARPALWVGAAVLLHFCALLSVFITERYRLAAVPGLLVLGSCALAWVGEGIARRLWLRLVVAVVLGGAAWACVFWPSPGVEMNSMVVYNLAISELDVVSQPRISLAEQERQLGLAQAHLATAAPYAPENPALLFALGRLQTLRGQAPAAIDYYRRCLRQDPRFLDALVNLGVLLLQQKQWAEAAGHLAQAAALSPEDPGPHYLYALALFNLGDQPGAARALEVAEKLEPANPTFRALRARLGQK